MKQTLYIFLSLFFSITINSQELSRYTCHVDRIDISEIEGEKKRTFDKEGVILLNKKYHPLNICQYGMLAHHYFKETSDSTYYYKCINQVKYFKDSTKYNYMFNNKGIGLPYNYNYGGLKAPWYSGMTQGYAISFLLRYYSLTKDKSILPIIEKIAYVLLSPQEQGGAISKTKEGCTWIEEYPNSKKSPQVLNGFINGFIGLHEYCQYFPKDKVAKRIHDETYESLKYSLDFYDTPNWSYYNRKKGTITNAYLRYQIYEMKQLFEIFNDPIFSNQMRIWSVMSLNKPIKKKSKAFKHKTHLMSAPAGKFDKKMLGPILKPSQKLTLSQLKVEKYKSWKHRKKRIKDKEVAKTKKSKTNIFSFNNSDSLETNYLEIIFNDTLKDYTIELFETSNPSGTKVNPIKFTSYISNNKLFLSFNLTKINNLLVKLKSKNKTTLTIEKTNFYNTKSLKDPFFVHFKTKSFFLQKDHDYYTSFDLLNSSNAVVFYKQAKTEKALNQSKWKACNTIARNHTPLQDGHYQFMIVYDWESPLSLISKFEILPF